MWRGFIDWLHSAVCALMSEDGRKAWAVMIAWGCGISMTAYASAVLWIVKDKPAFAFWLGLSAMFIVLVVITAFTGLLIKRSITAKFKDSEIGLTDHDGV